MTTPENTSKRDPLVQLAGLLSQGSDDYITGMEAEGQRQLVHSDVLPKDGSENPDLLALGFVFGEPTDDLFCKATLPEGWTRKGSDHAMWSYIVDERGIERVAIFYKAAFYDRSAHMRLERPGYSVAGTFIYGDGPFADIPWDALTDAERADFVSALEDYEKKAAMSPDIYGDRLPRVQDQLAALRGVVAADVEAV